MDAFCLVQLLVGCSLIIAVIITVLIVWNTGTDIFNKIKKAKYKAEKMEDIISAQIEGLKA